MASQFSTPRFVVSEPFPSVYHVEIARKPVNAFTAETWTEYGSIFDSLNASGLDVRVVVLSSAIPKIFTAGIDLSALSSVLDDSGSDSARKALGSIDIIRRFQSCISAPRRCRFPTIVAVHGPVIGLGIDIISACDIRYAARSATFSIKETEMGLAADIGTLANVPKVTGNLSLVREYAYSSAFFDVAVAERMGLISRIIEGGREEVVKAALDLAQVISRKSPVAVTGTKRLISHAIDHTIEENLEYTALWNSAAVSLM